VNADDETVSRLQNLLRRFCKRSLQKPELSIQNGNPLKAANRFRLTVMEIWGQANNSTIASFMSYAFSNNLGFSMLTGASTHLRLCGRQRS